MRFLIAILVFLSIHPLFAADGYIGEDLGTDLYRRVDMGNFKLKKQLVEHALKGSAGKINSTIGPICSQKWGERDFCFIEGSDFTSTEMENLQDGNIGAIRSHLKPQYREQSTDQLATLIQALKKYYQDTKSEIDYSQEKLHSVGSIGIFTDGSIDNSSYDLMYDLERIHAIIFAKDIPYNGTQNMGSESIANLLNGKYDTYPIGTNPPLGDDGGSGTGVLGGDTASGVTSLSGILSTGSGPYCPPTNPLPDNLDGSALSDIASQLTLGSSARTSFTLLDNGFLPEHWARIGRGNTAPVPPGGGSLLDKFPCSGSDFLCITIEFIMYSQNLLWGKASTIEKLIDDNLKIVNKFAGASMAQSKMTHAFFQCDICKHLNLPEMFHIGAIVSYLPAPILNLKPGNGVNAEEKQRKNEVNEVLVGTFEANGIQYMRQNSIETDLVDAAVSRLAYRTIEDLNLTINTPRRDAFVKAKEMELKKKYYDSFSDDLLELQMFTDAFSDKLLDFTKLIQALYDIPRW